MNWIDANNLKMNIGKTQLMILCRNRWSNVCDNLIISHRGVDIACKGSIRYLGVTVDSQLEWKEHIQHVRQKCFMSLSKLRRVSHFLPTPTRVKIYNALVLPHLDYSCVLWHSCGSGLTQKVEKIQNYRMRIITSSSRYTPSETLRSKLHWMTLSQRREVFQLSLVHRCIHDGAPKYLCSKFTLNREMQYART